MSTFAQKVIQFNRQLSFTGKLPKEITILNPFKENKEILPASEIFYNQFFDDNRRRRLILGINPGRFGAGTTGIPFTDTKHFFEACGIKIQSVTTHEPSSVFIYEMIEKYGGVKKFYGDFYLNAVCTLGFVRLNEKGHWVNYNYYDSDELFSAMKEFIVSGIRRQITFGTDTSTCFALGKKNAKYLEQLNKEEKFFDSIVALEHPRYIMQYKAKSKGKYIVEYINRFTSYKA